MTTFDDLAGQIEAIGKILPLWKRNLALAREQVESGGSMLAARFSGVVEQLQWESLPLQRSEVEERMLEVFAGLQQELRELLRALQNAHDVRNAELAEIRHLGGQFQELRGMLSGLVPAGMGDDGRKIDEKIMAINAALLRVDSLAGHFAQLDAKATQQVHRVLDAALQRMEVAMHQELEAARFLREVNAGVRGEISEILVALQHHDRVNQIVGHVEQDLDKLFGKLQEIAQALRAGHDLPGIELECWLNELECSYSTREQRAAHHGRSAAGPEDSDITFF